MCDEEAALTCYAPNGLILAVLVQLVAKQVAGLRHFILAAKDLSVTAELAPFCFVITELLAANAAVLKAFHHTGIAHHSFRFCLVEKDNNGTVSF